MARKTGNLRVFYDTDEHEKLESTFSDAGRMLGVPTLRWPKPQKLVDGRAKLAQPEVAAAAAAAGTSSRFSRSEFLRVAQSF